MSEKFRLNTIDFDKMKEMSELFHFFCRSNNWKSYIYGAVLNKGTLSRIET